MYCNDLNVLCCGINFKFSHDANTWILFDVVQARVYSRVLGKNVLKLFYFVPN